MIITNTIHNLNIQINTWAKNDSGKDNLAPTIEASKRALLSLKKSFHWYNPRSWFCWYSAQSKRQITLLEQRVDAYNFVTHKKRNAEKEKALLKGFMFGNNATQIERVHKLVLHHKICPETDSPEAYNADINHTGEGGEFKLTVPMLDEDNQTTTYKPITSFTTQELAPKYFDMFHGGLKKHDPNWTELIPVKHLTGQSNHVNHVSFQPWSKIPRPGGSFFGHTFIEIVRDNKLYTIGMNMKGELLMPDFLTYMSTTGKTVIRHRFEVDATKDGNNKRQIDRIFEKLVFAQEIKTTGKRPEKCSEEQFDALKRLINDQLYRKGVTCSGFAHSLVTEIANNQTGELGGNEQKLKRVSGLAGYQKLFYRLRLDKVFDTIWSVVPAPIFNRIIRPLQYITRGRAPFNIDESAS